MALALLLVALALALALGKMLLFSRLSGRKLRVPPTCDNNKTFLVQTVLYSTSKKLRVPPATKSSIRTSLEKEKKATKSILAHTIMSLGNFFYTNR
jgi:hypothetical protein